MKSKKTSLRSILLIITLLINSFFSFAEEDITGAGATFPAPIYIKWADTYYRETGKKINYQAIGSFGGIKQIMANTVDFGASDTPLSDAVLAKEHLFQFPTVVGGIVLVINLPGIKSNELVIDGKTLGDIYLGKITKWNDKKITEINPKLQLPTKTIVVIRRADSSGTSFIFTNYLKKVNKEWKLKVGSSSVVRWPTGLGAKGNNGVAAFVQRLPGSIGYVEYAYAKQSSLAYTKLVSADGKPVSPTKENFSNAAINLKWKKSFSQDLTNQKGENVWPITSTTFILLKKRKVNFEKNSEILNFFKWAYKHGGKQASDLEYGSLPENVINSILLSWREIGDNNGKALCLQ